MSDCKEIREVLWPLDRPRGVVEGEAEARAHLEECPDCQAFFERDAMITRALGSHDISETAPPRIRHRLGQALDREPSSERYGPSLRRVGVRRAVRTLPWVAAAGLAGLMLGLSRPSGESEGAYALDFLSRAVEADAVDQPDVQAVTAFFMRELGVAVTPVVLAENPMSRAMICLIEGERAALVEYEMDGYTLAHYRVPLEESRVTGGASPAVTEENGVCVYRWSDARFENALVSDMPEEQLISIAEANFALVSP